MGKRSILGNINMKIVYIGTREMGYECLKFLLQAYAQQLVAVYTLDESLAPKTAGYKALDDLMGWKKIPFQKVRDINAAEITQQIRQYAPDVIVQVAWSQIIKDEILRIPRRGCVGFHSSLLPRYRGGSPVNWGLINGEKEWGITFFYLEPGVDHGDIIAQKKFPIIEEDTCKTVYEKCTSAAVEILRECLPRIEQGTMPRKKQDDSKATVFKRRKPEDGVIDWDKTTLQLYNWVRALTHPYPGAFSFYKGKKIFIWKAKKAIWKGKEKPGTIVKVDKEVLVKTGDGALRLQSIQEEGRGEMAAISYGFGETEKLS